MNHTGRQSRAAKHDNDPENIFRMHNDMYFSIDFPEMSADFKSHTESMPVETAHQSKE
jgi:hypothetical protein